MGSITVLKRSAASKRQSNVCLVCVALLVRPTGLAGKFRQTVYSPLWARDALVLAVVPLKNLTPKIGYAVTLKHRVWSAVRSAAHTSGCCYEVSADKSRIDAIETSSSGHSPRYRYQMQCK